MKTIIANFKMNPASKKEAGDLFVYYRQKIAALKNVDFIVAPPFLYLKEAVESGLKTASQDCFYEDTGAYTGEISPLMLKNLGVQYVILGHSERRKLGETDEMINKKLQAVVRNGLIPILCVGETKKEKESGIKEEIIKGQLEKDLGLNSKFSILNSRLIIAYEPVWAIGSGDFCDPREANKIHEFIRNLLNSRFQILNSKILYGGSVDNKNIASFLQIKEIDGALVGGASLKKEEFARILEIADSM